MSSRVFVLGWWIGVALLASPAAAHRADIRSSLLRLDSDGWAQLEISPRIPPRVRLRMVDPPRLGSVVIEYRRNAAAAEQRRYPLDGEGHPTQTWPLGVQVVDQDKLEILDFRVLDASDTLVAVRGADLGSAPTARLMSEPLVYLTDTESDVAFTRGGDTWLQKSGHWSVGFDALRVRGTTERLNNQGNRAEIEYSINDGPWQIESLSFDVKSGKSRPGGRPGKYLPLAPRDRIRIKRVDIFDPAGHRFATLGIRIGKQGHYVDTTLP